MAALHGDPNMSRALDALIRSRGVRAAVETGTYLGDTTGWLATRLPAVWTCEIREDFASRARFYLAEAGLLARVDLRLGTSPAHLPGMLAAALARAGEAPVLVFLDAHWQDEWPLRAELTICGAVRRQHPGRLIVVIDDFEVPHRPEMSAPRGGGGTVGDPTYGPRAEVDPTPANLDTFGADLLDWPTRWWPDYPGRWAGWVLVADISIAAADFGGAPVRAG